MRKTAVLPSIALISLVTVVAALQPTHQFANRGSRIADRGAVTLLGFRFTPPPPPAPRLRPQHPWHPVIPTTTTTRPPATTTTAARAWHVPHPQVSVSRSVATPTTGGGLPGWMGHCILIAESGGRYNVPGTGGAWGFKDYVWSDLPSMGFAPAGAYEYPFQAPPPVQDAAALFEFHRFGWRPWNNHCTGTT